MDGFDELARGAEQRRKPVGLAVIGGAERTVLEAVREAADRGWVAPLVTGCGEEIRAVAEESGIDLKGIEVLDTEEPAAAAVSAVREGRAGVLMKGRVATPELMGAVLAPERGLRSGRVICQVVLVEMARDGRRLLLADTGICVRPTLEQKADILRHLAETARALGAEEPRIAAMSATEKPSEAIPDSLEAAELARRGAAGEFGRCRVEGPLSFDLAYAADSGRKKGVEGEVVGAADAMLFPDLSSANLTVKAIMYTADCRFGGVLCGAACPVVFMSRSDTTGTRLRSMSLALRLLEMKQPPADTPGGKTNPSTTD